MRRWSLSDLALARPVTVGMALIAVLVVGVIGLMRMPLGFLPRQQAARIYVRADITRTSPEVLERELVRPLEEEVAGIRGLRRIQVGSGAWGVRMNLEFEPGTDADARKMELRERIERVRPTLPEFVQNLEIGSYSQNDEPIMEMLISSGTDLSEDYYLIEERIVRRIERVEGVARVELDGIAPHELEVAVDVEAIDRTAVSLSEVGAAVREARAGRSLGLLRDREEQSGVRAPAIAADPERFATLPVRRGAETATPPATGPPATALTPDVSRGFATLGEVAEVSIHPEERREGKRLNGRRAIDIEVFAASGVSTVEVTEGVREAVQEMSADPALDGVEVLVFHDQGKVILDTLGDLRNSGVYGGLLAFVVLLLFLHRMSTTLAASVSVPLSVVAAGAVLFLRGEELNCIVLLGLVLGVGMLIDNAVVIVEAIATYMQRGEPPARAALLGAREVGFATIASTASTVIVFLPLVVNNPADEMSTYLQPLGTTFAIGLIASLFVSQTVVPLLMGRVLRPSSKPVRHPILDRVTAGYGWLIERTVRWPRLTVLLGLALAASAVYPALRLNVRLGRAEQKSDHLPIRLEFAGSRGYEKIEHNVIAVESALLQYRDELDIASVSCSYSDHWGNCRVYPVAAFQSEAEVELFEEHVRTTLPDQPGVKYRVNEPEFTWRENMDRKIVEFAVKGEDMGELMGLAERVADHLATRLPRGDSLDPDAGGYDTITTPLRDGSRELHVVLDDDRMHRLGLTADDIATRVSLAFQGLPLGRIRGERGELRLRLSAGTDDERAPGIEALRDLRLPLANGREIPLGAVATLELERRPWWIQRVDRQTEVRLQVRFHDSDSKKNFELVSEALDDFTFPPGYSWGRGTQWKGEKQASADMLINFGLCLLLVYAVMASLFESFLQPLGILLTCVLGGFGAPWALYGSDTTLDTTAIVGAFILVGIAVNNGIMLIDRTTQLRERGVGRERALAQAGRERLRPILMTVLTTVLGLVPMMIHHPTLAGVYYHAIAYVVAGGLVTSTVVTLVFLPAAYRLIEDMSIATRASWRRFGGGAKR